MSRTVLLADDHTIICEGLRSLLEKAHGLEVVAEAHDGRTAVQLTRQWSPDVVIMDIGMPGMNGIEATRQITAMQTKTKIIALSMHSRTQYVSSVLEAGASGYLLKDCAAEELILAIRAVLAGRFYLSKQITGVVMKDYVRHITEKRHTDPDTLTPREREILQLLAEGTSAKQMASQLHISVKTVETHRQHIMDKLNIRTIAGLTKYAIREGLTNLDDQLS